MPVVETDELVEEVFEVVGVFAFVVVVVIEVVVLIEVVTVEVFVVSFGASGDLTTSFFFDVHVSSSIS